jgi:hypothetical protein
VSAKAPPVLLLAGAALVLAGCSLEDDVEDARFFPARPEAGAIFTCRDRVEGGRIETLHGRDLAAGRFTYYRFHENVAGGRRQYERTGQSPGTKVLALVGAGRTVTVSVPLGHRDYIRLLYGSGPRQYAATFHACPRRRSLAAARRACRWAPFTACRSRNTQFAGGIHIDYAKAAGRERCAVLEFWTPRGTKPLRRRMFPRDRVRCP